MNVLIKSIPDVIEQSSWVRIPLSVGMADNSGKLRTVNGREFSAYVHNSTLYVLASLKKGETIEGQFIPDNPSNPIPPFKLSNWIGDDISAIQATFFARVGSDVFASKPMVFYIPGSTNAPPPPHYFFLATPNNSIEKEWRIKTEISEIGLRIEGSYSMYSDQDMMPFTLSFSDNTKEIDRLYMSCGEELFVDNASLLGLDLRYLGNGKWEAMLATKLVAGSKITRTGAFLCRGGNSTSPDAEDRLKNLDHRKEAKIVGILKT